MTMRTASRRWPVKKPVVPTNAESDTCRYVFVLEMWCISVC